MKRANGRPAEISTPTESEDRPRVVYFKCADCDEKLRGFEGQVAICPACGYMQDAPYRDEPESARPA